MKHGDDLTQEDGQTRIRDPQATIESSRCDGAGVSHPPIRCRRLVACVLVLGDGEGSSTIHLRSGDDILYYRLSRR